MSRVVALLVDEPLLARWLGFALEQQGYLVLRSEQAGSDLSSPCDGLRAWRPDVWLVSASLWRQARQSPLRQPGRGGDWQWLADSQTAVPVPGLWPAEPRALMLRLHEHLSRRRDGHAALLRHGALCLDSTMQTASVGHLPLPLSAQGLRLLQLFLQNPGRVFTRSQLLDAVWGDCHAIEPRSVDAQVYRLRRQLEAHGQGELLESVRGQGYRLRPDVRRPPALPASTRFSL